ncbi:MAG: hypothetical protein JWM05_2798 [Acidimicrobiales bacterium]|nr:hypothetical protein [Acidimicrobiales bacterium]
MPDDVFTIDEQERLTLRVHAQPGAGRSEVVGRYGDALKVRVAAPPERGRANEAIAGLLASAFGVPAGAVELVRGETSRSKAFRIVDLDAATARVVIDRLLSSPPGRSPAGRRG